MALLTCLEVLLEETLEVSLEVNSPFLVVLEVKSLACLGDLLERRDLL